MAIKHHMEKMVVNQLLTEQQVSTKITEVIENVINNLPEGTSVTKEDILFILKEEGWIDYGD